MNERQETAIFAGYCVGSVYGDDDPRVQAEERAVMTDDSKFELWAAKRREYERNMDRNGYAGVSLPAEVDHAA